MTVHRHQAQTLHQLSREFASAHASELLGLSADMQWESWTAENLLRDLPEKWQRSRVIRREQSPIGYAILSRKPQSVHVHHLIVGPNHRGAGLGDALLQDAMHQSRDAKLPLTLKVHESNNQAIEFYRRYGLAMGERQSNGYISMSLEMR